MVIICFMCVYSLERVGFKQYSVVIVFILVFFFYFVNYVNIWLQVELEEGENFVLVFQSDGIDELEFKEFVEKEEELDFEFFFVIF